MKNLTRDIATGVWATLSFFYLFYAADNMRLENKYSHNIASLLKTNATIEQINKAYFRENNYDKKGDLGLAASLSFLAPLIPLEGLRKRKSKDNSDIRKPL